MQLRVFHVEKDPQRDHDGGEILHEPSDSSWDEDAKCTGSVSTIGAGQKMQQHVNYQKNTVSASTSRCSTPHFQIANNSRILTDDSSPDDHVVSEVQQPTLWNQVNKLVTAGSSLQRASLTTKTINRNVELAEGYILAFRLDIQESTAQPVEEKSH